MKNALIFLFIFVGFQSFSMPEMTANGLDSKKVSIGSNHTDKKKRINKKRKRKCKQWGRRIYAG